MYNQIFTRRSVRTFLKNPFSSEDILYINKTLLDLANKPTIFNNKIEFELINQASGENEKIGTYGFVQNAAGFLATTTANSLQSIIDYGYIGQYAALKLLEKDIGCVWLGGTFNRETVKKSLNTNDLIPALIAIGYPKDQSFKEMAIRFAVKSSSRKDFKELFTDNNGKPLSEDHKFAKILEALRLAPSGTNRQPWRVEVDSNNLKIYMLRTPNYAKELNYDVQGLDMGIALAHLKIALDHFEIKHDIIPNDKIDVKESKILIATIVTK
jgi:nitroreductase